MFQVPLAGHLAERSIRKQRREIDSRRADVAFIDREKTSSSRQTENADGYLAFEKGLYDRPMALAQPQEIVWIVLLARGQSAKSARRQGRSLAQSPEMRPRRAKPYFPLPGATLRGRSFAGLFPLFGQEESHRLPQLAVSEPRCAETVEFPARRACLGGQVSAQLRRHPMLILERQRI
jgi:hypothetical protein